MIHYHNQAYFYALANDINTSSTTTSVDVVRSLSLFRDIDVDFTFLFARSLNISSSKKSRQGLDVSDWDGWAIYLGNRIEYICDLCNLRIKLDVL